MLTLITPTGARPEAFALCRFMMARQDYQGRVLWIVVDDGDPAQEPVMRAAPNWQVLTVRPYPLWAPGANTQGRNLLAALDIAEAHAAAGGYDLRLAVIEDDDWYAPGWLTTIASALRRAELTGECHARYYNVASRRFNTLGNAYHASLRCTAMRGAALQSFRAVLQTPHKYYDWLLWSRHPNKRVFEGQLTVGMKGLPGRPGIAAGHERGRGAPDRDLAMLRSWIGADAKLYERFYEEDSDMADMTTMIARRAFRYSTRRLVAGDVFEARPNDVRKLRALKFAELRQDPARAPALDPETPKKAKAPRRPPAAEPEEPQPTVDDLG